MASLRISAHLNRLQDSGAMNNGIAFQSRSSQHVHSTGHRYASPITIIETGIRQDAQGRYCLNDLHRASGSNPNHRPGEFLRNGQTKALVREIETAGISAVSRREGRHGGTFACRELVIAYAAWISPTFHLKVLQVFLTAAAPAQPRLLPRPQLAYMAEAWFAILRHQASCQVHRSLARALQIHASTLSQILNGTGSYGAGKCSTKHIARRVLHNFCPKRRVHPRQLSLL